MNRIEKMCRDNPNMTAMELATKAGVTRARVYAVLSKAGLKPGTKDRAKPSYSPQMNPFGPKMADGSCMVSSFKGAISEIVVTADLMKRGVHVYHCCSPVAPFDLVAAVGDKLVRVEVRSASLGADGQWRYSKPEDKNRYDVLAAVLRTGEIRYFHMPGFEWFQDIINR